MFLSDRGEVCPQLGGRERRDVFLEEEIAEMGPGEEKWFMQMKNWRKVFPGREVSVREGPRGRAHHVTGAGGSPVVLLQHVVRGSAKKSEAGKMRQGPGLQGLLVMLRDLDFNQIAVVVGGGWSTKASNMGVTQTDLHFRVIILAAGWRRERREARPESGDQSEDSFINPKQS